MSVKRFYGFCIRPGVSWQASPRFDSRTSLCSETAKRTANSRPKTRIARTRSLVAPPSESTAARGSRWGKGNVLSPARGDKGSAAVGPGYGKGVEAHLAAPGEADPALGVWSKNLDDGIVTAGRRRRGVVGESDAEVDACLLVRVDVVLAKGEARELVLVDGKLRLGRRVGNLAEEGQLHAWVRRRAVVAFTGGLLFFRQRLRLVLGEDWWWTVSQAVLVS